MKRATSMIVFAGPDAAKELAVDCRDLFPTSIRVSRILVRVTSESLPPCPSIADWIISRHLSAWPAPSPFSTVFRNPELKSRERAADTSATPMPRPQWSGSTIGHRVLCNLKADPCIGAVVAKTQNASAFSRNDRVRTEGIDVAKIVFLYSILGTQLIEIIIRHQFAIRGLP
jgi:hypothetical protein